MALYALFRFDPQRDEANSVFVLADSLEEARKTAACHRGQSPKALGDAWLDEDKTFATCWAKKPELPLFFGTWKSNVHDGKISWSTDIKSVDHGVVWVGE